MLVARIEFSSSTTRLTRLYKFDENRVKVADAHFLLQKKFFYCRLYVLNVSLLLCNLKTLRGNFSTNFLIHKCLLSCAVNHQVISLFN